MITKSCNALAKKSKEGQTFCKYFTNTNTKQSNANISRKQISQKNWEISREKHTKKTQTLPKSKKNTIKAKKALTPFAPLLQGPKSTTQKGTTKKNIRMIEGDIGSWHEWYGLVYIYR